MRRLFGLGPVTADLVAREAATGGDDAVAVLRRRNEALVAGHLTAVADLPAAAVELSERGALDLAACKLWPWAPPEGPPPGYERRDDGDAAAVAGAYYEAVERAMLFDRRSKALVALISREAARLATAELKAREDLAGFTDPQRYQRQAEALLAAGSRARREPAAWWVPDPYSDDVSEIRVPAAGGATLHATADALFRRHRRATRGMERARERARELASRVERFGALQRAFEASPDAAGLDAFETALREMGVPVGLEAPAVRRRAGGAAGAPRLEGVRLYTSSDGMTILAGRTARENDRLTFKLSATEDFWFHARDCPGAHVVVRNEARRKRPPNATLTEAAAVAAWYSDKRKEGRVDVQWTQRKNVRRVRGGPPGAVLIKRAETVRVVPALPRSV